MILPRDTIHAWVVIYFLIWVELGEKVWCYAQIMPGDIPLFDELLIVLATAYRTFMILIVVAELEVEVFSGDLLDYVILCAVDIHN